MKVVTLFACVCALIATSLAQEILELDDVMEHGSGRRFFLPPIDIFSPIIDAIKSLLGITGSRSRRTLQPEEIHELEDVMEHGGGRRFLFSPIDFSPIIVKSLLENKGSSARKSLQPESQDDGGDELLSQRRQILIPRLG